MKFASKKLTVVWSPCGGNGKSTITSYLSSISANNGYLTAYIELNRYCASSPYMLNTFSSEKSLKTAIDEDNERDILNNFVQSESNEKLFSISLNKGNLLDELYIFPIEKIQKIIQVARMNFERVFIEAPSNYIETGFIAAIESVPDRFIQVLDNSLVSWHTLKLYDLFLQEYDKVSILKPITVINKDHGLLDGAFISQIQKSTRILSPTPERTFYIPYYPRIIKDSNEGVVFGGNGKIIKVLENIITAIEDDSVGKLKIKLDA